MRAAAPRPILDAPADPEGGITPHQSPRAPSGPDTDVERRTLRKVAARPLIPSLFLLDIACYLDRVNVGFAALQ